MGTLTSKLDQVHPQMLRATGEGDRKKLAEDFKALIGRAIERSFALAGMSKQDAAYAMGYSDPGTVSRWCAGTERPLFDKLFTVEQLRQPLCVALAELAECEVETTVRIRRRA